MQLADRLDDVARQELDAERRRYLAALVETGGDPHVFLREFETHLSRVTDTMQRLARRSLGVPAADAVADNDDERQSA